MIEWYPAGIEERSSVSLMFDVRGLAQIAAQPVIGNSVARVPESPLAVLDRRELFMEQAGWMSTLFWYFPRCTRASGLRWCGRRSGRSQFRIDANRLHSHQFQCPVAAEPDIAESGGDMHEQAEAPHRRTPLQHWNEIMSLRPLERAPQVELVGVEFEPLGRNRQPAMPVRPPHVQKISS